MLIKRGYFHQIMEFTELKTFLRNKGVFDTFQILTQFKNYKVAKHTFYKKLNEFSYYNAFLRVKDKLLEKGIINIKKERGVPFISLTKKGVTLFEMLKELNNLIKS